MQKRLLFLSLLTYVFVLVFLSSKMNLQFLMQEGHLKVVEFLIEKGAKVDQATVRGVTPLQTASGVCILLLLLHNLSLFFF